ncbi:isochorismate synthase [Bacillus pinisoli]|uniref:isochorismate synthase n=1 Tax=Bacillus pinisoli TaxID=2901866 RepID=UPI001FF22AAD|nr:isochorismate synthase [Bacillus pinisoli]
MVTVQQKSILDVITEGIEQAKTLGHSILVSSTISIDHVDPLMFYEAGKKLFFGERFFWKEPHQEIAYVGLGASHVIETSEKTAYRYQHVELEWDKLIQTSVQTKQSATHIKLFGGFSFDPLKKRTSLWEDFPESKFYLPTYMLTSEKEGSWLTVNLLVTAIDRPDNIYKNLEREKLLLLKSNQNKPSGRTHTFTEKEVEVEKWLKSIENVISHINEGKLEKAVLARELTLHSDEVFDIRSILMQLQQKQPTSYLFAMESGSSTFIGATPERLLKKENQSVLSTCLAGSIKRGKTEIEDQKLERELLHDVKNLEEHQFVVQMISQELEQVCQELTTADKPTIFKAKDIQHLYTPITGKVKDGVHLLSLVEQLHPTPALGGFPQEKALVEIREQELLDRGWYAGPIGWIDGDGNGEFAVAIRSGLIKQKQASLFAGCGIVGKSEPIKEYEETQIKFKPMLTAIGGKGNE